MIINEDPTDRAANITAHGAVDTEYPALDKEHDYVFVGNDQPSAYWQPKTNSITAVEIGTEAKPTSTAMWFNSLTNCTSMDLDGLNTSSVTDMSSMFSRCSSITTLDLSNFNTSSVTNMGDMFGGCTGLTTLDLSNFNTSSVTNMSSMFNSTDLTSLDLTNFNTSSVTDVSYMFSGSKSLATIIASNAFTIDGSTTNYMFSGCTSLVGGNGTTYSADHTDGTYARIDAPGTPGYFTAD